MRICSKYFTIYVWGYNSWIMGGMAENIHCSFHVAIKLNCNEKKLIFDRIPLSWRLFCRGFGVSLFLFNIPWGTSGVVCRLNPRTSKPLESPVQR